MKEFLIYLAGKFIKTEKKISITAPFSDEVIGTTFCATDKEINSAISAGANATEAMRSLPSFERQEILNQMANNLQERMEEFTRMIVLESAKPYKYALSEVKRAIQTLKIAAEESVRIEGEYLTIDRTKAGIRKQAIVKRFPIGLIAGIAPFNFPLNLAVHKIAPAIAAGCPLILKPASATPLSMLLLAEIIDQTKIPKGCMSILPTDRKAGNQLVTNDNIKLLTFTGSPEVGWQMKNDAGKKKVVLELGGNAATIVTPSANLDVALKKCLIGAFAFSGQVCIHSQRFFVHESVFERFTNDMVLGAKGLKYGDPMNKDTDISSMIDTANAKRVEEWVNEAIKEGAKLLCGGNRKKRFYEPTILTRTSPQMKVNSEEIFGPVITIEPYQSFEEAIDRVNNTKFGLQAAIFSNDFNEILRAFEKTAVGGLIVNDSTAFRTDHMPYGGIKDSGLGREGIKYSIRDMTEEKIMVF